MSYMQCAKCGGMFGVIGNVVYTCGCVPPIDKNTQAAAAPTEEITCLLARAHMPAGAYWQQIHDIVQKWAARCANEARLGALEQAARPQAERVFNALADSRWLNNCTAPGSIEIIGIIERALKAATEVK